MSQYRFNLPEIYTFVQNKHRIRHVPSSRASLCLAGRDVRSPKPSAPKQLYWVYRGKGFGMIRS